MDTRTEHDEQEETMWDEIKGKIAGLYKRVEDWMRPNKAHPVVLQILLFILKLPVLLLILVFSPVVLVVLLFVFFAAF